MVRPIDSRGLQFQFLPKCTETREHFRLPEDKALARFPQAAILAFAYDNIIVGKFRRRAKY